MSGSTTAPPSPTELGAIAFQGEYLKVLVSPAGTALRKEFLSTLLSSTSKTQTSAPTTPCTKDDQLERLAVGIAALNAFLQINVTGPALDVPAFDAPGLSSGQVRKECLRALEIDGVGPYAYIPAVELFSLARYALLALDPEILGSSVSLGEGSGSRVSLAWVKLRVHVWHYRLLTQPSLGPSSYSKGGRWSDVPSLVDTILENMGAVKSQVVPDDEQDVWATSPGGGGEWSREDKAECLLELANYDIMLGRDDKARGGIKRAKDVHGFEYVLTGAMGKRTRYQENSTSQLVVLARSASSTGTGGDAKPEALALNDDVLLEKISFDDGDQQNAEVDKARDTVVPASLRDLSPDDQPQLSPLDQILLLTEATLKDAFSPVDTLTAAEVMPFAERVLGDKSTNWQVYTQALIVRSRVEVHRSRTVERGVLQMQAVVDQVVVDTSSPPRPRVQENERKTDEEAGVPAIEITPAEVQVQVQEEKPVSFLPAPKETESAPAHERLRYINALSTPPRWHLESELAYGWAGVGALVSALEIFKRLRLWAEVALCLATAGASSADDESGRGSGGEDKARGILRWRLFNRTGTAPGTSVDADDEGVSGEDIMHLKPAEWMGPERVPPPANAARLLCILGDVEEDPSHYTRAWSVSGNRFARAQKSLGEWYLQKKDLPAAKEAYERAVGVNRLNPELWNRVGDIRLRMGEFESAAEAYRRGIAAASDVIGGEDARSWSNLGSALWSLYCDAVEEAEKKKADGVEGDEQKSLENEQGEDGEKEGDGEDKDPSVFLGQALNAYKRGAKLARENWRISDNVLTLAARVVPLPITDMIHALRNIIRIRNTEDALDVDILRLLVHEAVLCKPSPGEGAAEPLPRGSSEKAVVETLEGDVVPLITKRSELWELVSRARAWRRDFPGAIDASEKAWRAAVGMSGNTGGGGLLPSAEGPGLDWRSDVEAWGVVVKRTDELVSVLENFGPRAEGVGEKWRGKARSAVRSVMGKGRDSWEGSEGWKTLEGLMEGLKIAN